MNNFEKYVKLRKDKGIVNRKNKSKKLKVANLSNEDIQVYLDRAFMRYNSSMSDEEIYKFNLMNDYLNSKPVKVNIGALEFSTDWSSYDMDSIPFDYIKSTLQPGHDYIADGILELCDKRFNDINMKVNSKAFSQIILDYIFDTKSILLDNENYTGYKTMSRHLWKQREDRRLVSCGIAVAKKIRNAGLHRIHKYGQFSQDFLLNKDIELQYFICPEIINSIGFPDKTDYIQARMEYYTKYAKAEREDTLDTRYISAFRDRNIIAPSTGFVIEVYESNKISKILVREMIRFGKHYILLGIQNKLIPNYVSFATIDLSTNTIYSEAKQIVKSCLPYLYSIYEVNNVPLNLSHLKYRVYEPSWWKYRGNIYDYIGDSGIVVDRTLKSAHIRNMPKGNTASELALEIANVFNINLGENQTIVVPKELKEEIIEMLNS